MKKYGVIEAGAQEHQVAAQLAGTSHDSHIQCRLCLQPQQESRVITIMINNSNNNNNNEQTIIINITTTLSWPRGIR